MLEIGAIVWGVRDLNKSIQFWSEALNYELRREPDVDFAILLPKDGVGIQLSLNSAITSTKPKRHHIDLFTMDQEGEVERLLRLGATRVDWEYEPDADYVVLADPDGNTFCVVEVEDYGLSQHIVGVAFHSAGIQFKNCMIWLIGIQHSYQFLTSRGVVQIEFGDLRAFRFLTVVLFVEVCKARK